MVQQLTIGGGFNGQNGVVSVPSTFAGDSTTPGSINYALQQYLLAIAQNISTGGSSGTNFINYNVVTSPGSEYTVNSAGSTTFEEFTNTNSDGSQASGSVPGGQSYYDIAPTVTALAVQAPGNLTLNGGTAPSTTFALFGANSNVTYSTSDGVPESIFAAGGADSIKLSGDGNVELNDTVYSSGTDTIDAFGEGSVQVNVEPSASDFVKIDQSYATVNAYGSTTVGWQSANSGGNLYFVNDSNDTAYVQAGVFGTASDKTQVTAFGGAGGGFFIGGQGGGAQPNLLVGGAPGSVSIGSSGQIVQVSADSTAGATTLVGAVNGDILDAQGDNGQNALFAGSGTETLIAASSTGANLFQLGLNYPGLGSPQSNGVVSTDGAGAQTFFLGNSEGATLYGSTAANADNVYNFVSDATAGGGTFTIYNFTPNTNQIFLTDAADTGPGTASITASDIFQDPSNSNIAEISLSDGTTIKLVGVQASQIGFFPNANQGQTLIYTTSVSGS